MGSKSIKTFLEIKHKSWSYNVVGKLDFNDNEQLFTKEKNPFGGN